MEVKIGVRDVAREVVLESELTPDAVAEAVNAAVSSQSLLQLTDDHGRLVIVPGSRPAFAAPLVAGSRARAGRWRG